MSERRLDDTGPVPGPTLVTTREGGSLPSQLTEREWILYATGHREAYRELLDEFRGRAADPDSPTAMFAATTASIIAAALERADRIVPIPDLPPAPCGIGGAIDGRTLLCGDPAGHEGLHAWQAFRQARAGSGKARHWWQLPL